MAVPITRDTFKEYCLRRLGKPVITIDVDDTQVEDRIDDALTFYTDYHFDGTTLEYFKHVITTTDKSNEFITLPDSIVGAVEIFDLSSFISNAGLFSVRFQEVFQNLDRLQNLSVTGLYLLQERLAAMDEMLTGETAIRYNRVDNKLHLDLQWANLLEGSYVIVKAYQRIDETTTPDIWKDQWLQRYATALIKRQWGSNITKFEGMQLPGNIQFSGQKIYDDAQAEIEKLETEVVINFSLPVHDMIG